MEPGGENTIHEDPYSDSELLSFLDRTNLLELRNRVTGKDMDALINIWHSVNDNTEVRTTDEQTPGNKSEGFSLDPPSPFEKTQTVYQAVEDVVSQTPPTSCVEAASAHAKSQKRSFSWGLAVGCVGGMVIGSSLTFWAVARRGDTPRSQAERSVDSAKGRLNLAAGILKDKSRLAKFSPDEISRMRRGVETGNANLLPGGLLTRQFDADPESKGLSKQFD